MKDFFVSFNSADKAWADWIAWTLEEAGYQVCGCTSATRTSSGRASAGTRGILPRRGGMWRGRGSW